MENDITDKLVSIVSDRIPPLLYSKLSLIYDPKSKQMYTPNTKEWTSINEAMKGGEKDEDRNPIQSEDGQEGIDGNGLRERGGPGQQDTA